jgi:hypothetical protein
MNTSDLEAKLREAIRTIDALPEPERAALMEMVEETRRRHQSIHLSTKAALAAVDDWRLIQKYRLFDAEATSREQASDE